MAPGSFPFPSPGLCVSQPLCQGPGLRLEGVGSHADASRACPWDCTEDLNNFFPSLSCSGAGRSHSLC